MKSILCFLAYVDSFDAYNIQFETQIIISTLHTKQINDRVESDISLDSVLFGYAFLIDVMLKKILITFECKCFVMPLFRMCN